MIFKNDLRLPEFSFLLCCAFDGTMRDSRWKIPNNFLHSLISELDRLFCLWLKFF